MSKEMGVIVLGLWVAVLPYLGFPTSWKTVLLVLSGLGIGALGFMLRAQLVAGGSRRNRFFIENDVHENHHAGHEHHHSDHTH